MHGHSHEAPLPSPVPAPAQTTVTGLVLIRQVDCLEELLACAEPTMVAQHLLASSILHGRTADKLLQPSTAHASAWSVRAAEVCVPGQMRASMWMSFQSLNMNPMLQHSSLRSGHSFESHPRCTGDF